MKRLALTTALVVIACAPKPNLERIKLMRHLKDARPAAQIVAIQELAPHANAEETAAIARTAQDATADVRKAVALALAKVDVPNAIDLTAALLHDPSDEVRAAAVTTLTQLGGPRAATYIAHAYATGGPQVRAVIAAAGPALLVDALKVESDKLTEERDRRSKDRTHDMIRAEAIVDLGRHATPAAVAELSGRLVDTNPVIVAAACGGLAEAMATDQVPFILQALKSGQSEVIQGCAPTLALLDPEQACAILPGFLKDADAVTADVLFEILEHLNLTPGARDALCHTAQEHPVGPIALRAAGIVGATCTSPAKAPATWTPRDQLLVWTALERKDPSLLQVARQVLPDKDASLATAAAGYLGVAGTPPDGLLLRKAAHEELNALDSERSRIANDAEARQAAVQAKRDAQEKKLRMVLGDKYPQYAKLQPPLRDKLLARLGKKMGPEVSDEFEQRPGAIDFIVACTTGAVRLGSDVADLAGELFAEKELRLRTLAVELANATGATGDTLRTQARTDAESAIQRLQAGYDLAKGDATAIDRLSKLTDSASPSERIEIAQELTPMAAKAVKPLIALAQGGDDAADVALVALAKIPGPEVDQVIVGPLAVTKTTTAVASVAALRERSGPAIDDALVRSAVHPAAEVRAASLAALQAHHTCTAVSHLAPLQQDYIGAVRTAASAFVASCK